MKTKNDEGWDLKARTRQFALRIIKLYAALPERGEAQVLGKQLLRSGTSVGAHYREATRGRSAAEFLSKVNGALMELEETLYWLELIEAAEIIRHERLTDLKDECSQLTAILVRCVKNASAG